MADNTTQSPARETLQERLRSTTQQMADNSSCPMKLWNQHSSNCLQAVDALDAAEARIKELETELDKAEDKISEIEGVWPDWAEKLLDIIYPRECRAWEDQFDLPEDLQEWLRHHETALRRTALKGAQSNG